MRISVITPVFNRVDMIADAIESVLAQSVDEVEHIVIDAGSTDGTLEVLSRYAHLCVVSEPDQGIYDGMNKGLDLARGNIFVILNSDDRLLPGALEVWQEAFANNPDADMVSAAAQLADAATGAIILTYDVPRQRTLDCCEALLGLPIINARAFKRDLWARLGGFNLRYPTMADRDWLVKAASAGAKNVAVAGVIYQYRAHAGSATFDMNASSKMRLDYALEACTLARVHIKNRCRCVRRAARILNDKSAASAFAHGLKEGNPTACLRALGYGFSLNPLWPVSVLAMLLARWLGLKNLRAYLEGCKEACA